MAMKKLYCPECSAYLEGGSGDLVDCHCGWKQPDSEPKRYNVCIEWPDGSKDVEFEAENDAEADEIGRDIFHEHCNYGVSTL